MDAESLTDVLPLVAPLVVVQIGLILAGLLDLRQRKMTRGPRWAWVLIVLFVGLIGPTIYFLYGREAEHNVRKIHSATTMLFVCTSRHAILPNIPGIMHNTQSTGNEQLPIQYILRHQRVISRDSFMYTN